MDKGTRFTSVAEIRHYLSDLIDEYTGLDDSLVCGLGMALDALERLDLTPPASDPSKSDSSK